MESGDIPTDSINYLLLQAAGPQHSLWLGVAIMAVLLMCSALMSGSEVAFFSLKQADLTSGERESNGSTANILKLLERPDLLLSTILIANTFVNLATVIVCNNFILDNILPPDLPEWGSYLIRTVLVTFMLVLFGEVAPKVYASANNYELAVFMARPMLLLRTGFRPLSFFMAQSTYYFERQMEKQNNSSLSSSDLGKAIDLTITEDTKFAKQDVNILKGIVNFGNKTVTQIMCPRVDIVAVEQSATYHQLLKVIRENGYSRMPVYDEDLDAIKGILYSKDLLEHLDKPDDFDWKTLLRQAFFVPENKKIDDLLQEFRQKRTHLAIVVDEYGGTMGLLSLEDVMEEIVGDIKDELDDDLSQFDKINDHTYIFDGKIPLADVDKIMGIEESPLDEISEEVDTLAGLVLELHGRIPRVREVIRLEGHPFELTIMQATKRRVEKIKVARTVDPD